MKGLSGRLPILIFLGRREIEKAPLRSTGAGETGRDRSLGVVGGGFSERHREELHLLAHPAAGHTGLMFYIRKQSTCVTRPPQTLLLTDYVVVAG